MPFVGELTMEFCDVETPGVSRDDIVKAVHTQPRDPHDWFLTLRRGDDDYMDSTMEDDTTFSVRYSEAGKTFSTTAPIDETLLEALLVSFYEHDGAWKSACEWKDITKKPGFSLKNLFS